MNDFITLIIKKIKKARIEIIVCSCILVFFLTTVIVHAVQVSEDQKENILAVPTIQVKLDEQGFTSDPNGDTETMLADKKAKVTNSGELPVFVRALVIPTFQKSDDMSQDRDNLLKQSSVLPIAIAKTSGINTIVLNTKGAKWQLGSDGYYYYIGVLNHGVSTENLIDGVTKPTNLSDFKGYQFNMDIKIEAISAYSKRDGEKAYIDAWNGPIDSKIKSQLDVLSNKF